METRRTNKRKVTTTDNRVDTRPFNGVASAYKALEVGTRQPHPKGDKAVEGRAGSAIHEDAWYEFVLVAQYIYRTNPDAEIADVFEWLRIKDMGGVTITPGLLKRVNREIATELGPWDA